jgi:hypothetical protein
VIFSEFLEEFWKPGNPGRPIYSNDSPIFRKRFGPESLFRSVGKVAQNAVSDFLEFSGNYLTP